MAKGMDRATDQERSKSNEYASVFDRVQEINRSVLDRVREMRQVEQDYGAKLVTSKSPAEAMGVCNEWMAKRLEMLATEQQHFARSWLDLVSHLSKSAMPKEAASDD
jgi:hypothetical protein